MPSKEDASDVNVAGHNYCSILKAPSHLFSQSQIISLEGKVVLSFVKIKMQARAVHKYNRTHVADISCYYVLSHLLVFAKFLLNRPTDFHQIDAKILSIMHTTDRKHFGPIDTFRVRCTDTLSRSV